MSFKNYVEESVAFYNGCTLRVTKIKKKGLDIRGSVDGNKYGLPYDKTVMSGFSDKTLKAQGYTELVGFNMSVFYMYDGACYAEGIEISMGNNNQDFGMSCVTKFNETMAVGFTYDGKLIFDRQKNIMAIASNCYGAATSAFGIMKDGVKAEWGKSEHASIYNTVSGRTILGQNDDYIFVLAIAGVTGKSGLYGSQLFALCQKFEMKDAACFDGGGSVWKRTLGTYIISTKRLVKNAGMIWGKIVEDVEPEIDIPEMPESEEKQSGGIYMTCIKTTTSKGYPTRYNLDPKGGFTDKYIKICETVKIKDINSMEGKLDGYCQIDGGDKDGLWFAFDPDYFE